MNSYIECEQFDITHIAGSVPTAEINTVTYAIKQEIEFTDIELEHIEIKPDFLTPIVTISEVKDSEGSLVKSLEEHNRKPQENNTHEPVVHELCETNEEECDLHVCDHMARTAYSCRHSNSVSERNDLINNVCLQTTNICNNNHMNKVLEKRFTCNICSKSFPRKQDRDRHMQTHSFKKPFQCSICNKLFARKYTLKMHNMHNHSGKERPFTCAICDKSFFEKRHLAYHSLIHIDGKPFTCDICGKSYSRQHDLVRHTTCIHTRDKPFECDFCSKSFARKSNLILHMYTHTGEKAFECNICAKTFSRKFDLNRHEATHMAEKAFTCDKCGKSFSVKQYLATHWKKHIQRNYCA